MSWWTDIRDTTEKVATLGLYDPAASRQNERDQRNMINAQINAYRDQTNLTRQQMDEARDQALAEKRRINEKQIRALRGSYRAQSPSLLGVGAAGSQDMSSQLGG